MVNAEPNFIGHLNVIDGCSQVFVDAFEIDRGVGTRACFGVGSLGGAVSCNVELQTPPPTNQKG